MVKMHKVKLRYYITSISIKTLASSFGQRVEFSVKKGALSM